MIQSCRYILLTLCLITALACKNFDEPELNFEIEGQSLITIAHLNTMVVDEAITITQPLMIEGYVASSDEDSNFHKTFIINDSSGGVEIMAGIYDLHVLYPEGQKLYIALQGCTLSRSYGVVQIGLGSEEHSGFDVDYFGSRVLLDKHISRSAENRIVTPTRCEIAALQPDDCGRLITVSAISLVSAEYADGWNINTEGKWLGYNIFRSAEGHEIAVYISEYASYSGLHIPTSEVDITGILQRGEVAGEERYMLKMSREDDCKEHI